MDFDRPDTESMLAAFAESDFSRDEKSWSEAVEKDRPPDEDAIPEPDAEGNYSTSVLERMREAWQQHNRGEIADGEVQDLLDRVLEALDGMLVTMRQSIEQGQVDPSNPITQAIQVGFFEHREAIQRMQGFFESRDRKAVEEGLLAAQAATNRLMDAYAFFQRIKAAVSHIACPHCAVENPRAATKCSGCGGALIGLAVDEKPQARVVAVAADGAIELAPTTSLTTPNFQKVAEGIAMWENNEIDDDALWHTLSDVERQMQTHFELNAKGRNDTEKLSEDQRKLLCALIDTTEAALQANLDALAEMKVYWEDGDTFHVNKGFEALGTATQLIVEAFQASESVMVASAQQEAAQTDQGE